MLTFPYHKNFWNISESFTVLCWVKQKRKLQNERSLSCLPFVSENKSFSAHLHLANGFGGICINWAPTAGMSPMSAGYLQLNYIFDLLDRSGSQKISYNQWADHTHSLWVIIHLFVWSWHNNSLKCLHTLQYLLLCPCWTIIWAGIFMFSV